MENEKIGQFSFIPFDNILKMIKTARQKADYQVNRILIELYLSIGCYVDNAVKTSAHGKSIVEELSRYLLSKEPGIRGFSSRNIWRMKQFYETYKDETKLSTLLTEISWSNHLQILSKTKTQEERLFYLEIAAKQPYSARELSRIIDAGTYERTMLSNKKLSSEKIACPHNAENIFKDIYLFEFIGTSENYRERDLQKLLLKHMRQFLLEMGPNFSFIGEEYTVQVGNSDYKIDLLLHHRELNCLVAVELKITDFQPEYLGKLEFYLEALDRNVKKIHENPSVGLLICKSKNEAIVRYAMSRTISPTIIAEYETKLIDKTVLRNKLRDLLNTIPIDNEVTQD